MKSVRITIDSTQSGADNQFAVREYAGHVVNIWGYVSGINFTSTAEIVIGTLSGVVLPVAPIRSIAMNSANAFVAGTPCYLILRADGVLSARATEEGTNRSIYFNLTYIR